MVTLERRSTPTWGFRRAPIRLAWFSAVLPALMLNYFGQGALLLQDASAAVNPFYGMGPRWALYPLVVLATVATSIASQAVISGAFSLTRQAIQLGYLPRMRIEHTSEREIGQIYIPGINWVLMFACTPCSSVSHLERMARVRGRGHTRWAGNGAPLRCDASSGV